jgi:hypothetical protein
LDTAKDKTLASSVLPWNPNANGPVSSIAVSCNTVYVAGSFTAIGGRSRNRIAALDGVTGAATDWNPDADGNVLKLYSPEAWSMQAADSPKSVGNPVPSLPR